MAWAQEPAGTPDSTAGQSGGDGAAGEAPTETAPAIPTAPPVTPSVDALRPAMQPRAFEDFAAANPAAPGQDPAGPQIRLITEDELAGEQQSYPYIEWHGYFRFRADAFSNLDLNTEGTSPILPPIEQLMDASKTSDFGSFPSDATDSDGDPVDLTKFADKDAELLGGANIRMRLRPIFHLGENLRVHLEMNILDNVVLGSTPDGFDPNNLKAQRIDTPLLAFSGSQRPPTIASAGRDSVSVTQAYGELRFFLGSLRLGRMASQWGLGMLANGGGNYSAISEPRVSYRGVSMAGHGCLDCDYADYVDRALVSSKFFGTYVVAAWDYNVSGPTDYASWDYFGQPMDVSQDDDVTSLVFAAFQRPLLPEDVAERNRRLKELRLPAWDWGAYFVYRSQGISAETFNGVYDSKPAYAEEKWAPRGAEAYIPDFWVRFQSEPSATERYRLEIEATGVFGTIENATIEGSTPVPVRYRDISQLGAALEFEVQQNELVTGLNAGYASGRSLDACSDAETAAGTCEDVLPTFAVRDGWKPNTRESKLTNFRFDRNYTIDMILFREIIGTVTNAIYANPFIQYDFMAKQNDVMGVRLDVISSVAANAEFTPSGEGYYGTETDLTLYYREPRYGADIAFGYLFTGSAFDGKAGRARLESVYDVYRDRDGFKLKYEQDVDAANAWSLQGRFFWAF
jgi:uncharacterized protein (TIGR04551 family)